MEGLSVGWAEFVCAQEELKKSKTSNDRQWGLEYALDKTLDDIEKSKSFDRSDVERRIQAGARRNRHRTRLLRLYPLTWQPDTIDLRETLEARSELNFLCEALDDGFELAKKVAKGFDYRELARAENVEPSTLRKRVSRFRKDGYGVLSEK